MNAKKSIIQQQWFQYLLATIILFIGSKTYDHYHQSKSNGLTLLCMCGCRFHHGQKCDGANEKQRISAKQLAELKQDLADQKDILLIAQQDLADDVKREKEIKETQDAVAGMNTMFSAMHSDETLRKTAYGKETSKVESEKAELMDLRKMRSLRQTRVAKCQAAVAKTQAKIDSSV